MSAFIAILSKVDLPIATYVVDKAGIIIYCDSRVEEILGSEAKGKSMATYYVDATVRERLFDELEKAEASGRPLQKTVLNLKARGQQIFVQDFARRIYDEQGSYIGLLCCMMEYTREQRSIQLYETLPAAIYELDPDGRIVDGNEHLARLLGYDNLGEIRGKGLRSFYLDPSEEDEIAELLVSEKPVVDHPVELYMKNEDTIFAATTTALIQNENGQPCGREGVLIDVTRQERYRRLLEHVPIGLYIIRRKNGEEFFEDCNDTFAAINGFDSASNLRGKRVAGIHATMESYRKFIRTIESSEHPKIERIKIRHENKVAEVVNRLVKNRSGKIMGRVGAGRDVTAEESNREWLEVISRYIGNVLHTYQSSLISLDSSFEVLGEYCGERSSTLLEFRPNSAARVIQVFTPPLVAAVEELLRLRGVDSNVQNALREGGWASLERHLEHLRGRIPDPPELNHAFLRDAGLEVLRLLSLDRHNRIPEQLKTSIQTLAETVARVACAQTIRFARARIAEMSWEVKSLRDAVVSRSMNPPSSAVLDLVPIVTTVVSEHHDHARCKGIELRFQAPQYALKIRGVSRDLGRAVGNLIHNAIKYSWSRHDTVFVQIQLLRENTSAIFEVENWGVAVLPDEKNLVFQEGFRGSLSGDRQRAGTGLGLADAKRVVEESGGSISLSSIPAGGASRKTESRPFKTTVRIEIPIVD